MDNEILNKEAVDSLEVHDTLIIYDHGHYKLDGMVEISDKIINKKTEIRGLSSSSIKIVLQNTKSVRIKKIFVPEGNLSIFGGGILLAENYDRMDLGAVFGIRVSGMIEVLEGSTLVGMGRCKTSIRYAEKYGIYCESVTIMGGSRMAGSGDKGIYVSDSIVIQHGNIRGVGGYSDTSYGIKAEKNGITVQRSGRMLGVCSNGGYSGIVSSRINITGGKINGIGGKYGIFVENNGNIEIYNQGNAAGKGKCIGVLGQNSDIVVQNAKLIGEGERQGIKAGGSIQNVSGVIEGYTIKYGKDEEGCLAAVSAENSITVTEEGKLIENYSEQKYLGKESGYPYPGVQSRINARNYKWFISEGNGEIEVASNGEEIHPVRGGFGILTGIRIGNFEEEVVKLDINSLHAIHIPVQLEADSELFAVLYHGNGAESGEVPHDVRKYKEKDLVNVKESATDIKKEGNIFVGWSTQSDGTGIIYQAGNKFYMPGQNLILYAVWKPHFIDAKIISKEYPYHFCECLKCGKVYRCKEAEKIQKKRKRRVRRK